MSMPTESHQPLAPMPRWVAVLATLLFLAVELLFVVAFQRYERTPPPIVVQLVVGGFVGALVAAIVVGAAYVNRDAKRRGMPVGLWTALVVFIPNAIGFLLYFLARSPIRVVCGKCGALARSGSVYCSTCGSALTAVCGRCGSSWRETDAYCSHCGLKRVA